MGQENKREKIQFKKTGQGSIKRKTGQGQFKNKTVG